MRDADNTPLTILHTIYDVQGDQLSQELQLTYQTESLVGVVGLYYFEQTSDDIVTVELNPPPPGIQRDSDNNKVDNNSWAAFTQWTYNVTDNLAHRRRSLHRGREGLVPGSVRYSNPPSSRCRCSGIATRSSRSRRRRRSPIAGPTMR